MQISAVFILVACSILLNQSTIAQNPIVLRDLSIIRGQSIVDFDRSFVRFSDGRQLGLDEVLSATVSPERQSEFNQFVSQFGQPFSRLKQRLSLNDWAGVGELAEPMYRELKLASLSGVDDSLTTYLICVATMKARLYAGNRAGAVLPFLKAAKIAQSAVLSDEYSRFLSAKEIESMLSSDILPIWFDRKQVEIAFRELANSFVPTSATKEIGAIVYLASMAIQVERFDLARELIQLVEAQGATWKSWHVVLQNELAIATDGSAAARLIDSQRESLTEPASSIMIYLHSTDDYVAAVASEPKLGVPDGDDQTRNDDLASSAMLNLLMIPATHGSRYPALAAAALFRAAEIATARGWHDEQAILQQKLKLRFPDSYHAKILGETPALK